MSVTCDAREYLASKLNISMTPHLQFSTVCATLFPLCPCMSQASSNQRSLRWRAEYKEQQPKQHGSKSSAHQAMSTSAKKASVVTAQSFSCAILMKPSSPQCADHSFFTIQNSCPACQHPSDAHAFAMCIQHGRRCSCASLGSRDKSLTLSTAANSAADQRMMLCTLYSTPSCIR